MKKFMVILSTVISSIALAQTPEDNKELSQMVTTLEHGWNTKSGATFASVFAEVHDYIVINGFYFKDFTREANARAHQGLFNGIYKDNVLVLKTDKTNFLRPDLAITTVLGATYPKGGKAPTDPTAIMTIITEKKNNEWKITYFHNHSLNEAFQSNGNHPPFQVMYATWYKN